MEPWTSVVLNASLKTRRTRSSRTFFIASNRTDRAARFLRLNRSATPMSRVTLILELRMSLVFGTQ